MRRPENGWRTLPADLRRGWSAEVWEQVETDLRYEGYIRRQEEGVTRARGMEERSFPPGSTTPASGACAPKRSKSWPRITPANLGQASRISGVTPADIALLSVWVERGTRLG